MENYLSAVDVRGQADWLTGTNIAQLRLLQVGRNPEMVERHDRHQCYTSIDEMADLNVALSDDTAHRCDSAILASRTFACAARTSGCDATEVRSTSAWLRWNSSPAMASDASANGLIRVD